VGVLFFQLDGRLTDANAAFERMSGYSREELLTMTHWEVLTPPEYRGVTTHAAEELAMQGETAPYEKQLIRKDGSRWWGLFSSKRLSGRGAHAECVEFILDITERKQTEEALRASEERFRTLADAVPQLIWTNEAAGQATYFNQRWFEYSGLSYEQSFGLGWQVIVHPDDAPASVARWQQALAAEMAFETEYRLRRADGVYHWHLGRNVPLKDRAGRISGWFGSATDIEDLKQAETARRESEERFRLLVEGARDYAMFLLDPDNCITFWSVGAERVF
jgi:PAS domain S-box-containing protein